MSVTRRAVLRGMAGALVPWLTLAQTGASDAPQASRPAARLAEHVVLISIDGLKPRDYLPAAGRAASTPALDALRARGSWAEGVLGQYPSLTYPSHTSIVTGVRPARHGVVHNTAFDAASGPGGWYFESTAIQVPALWEAARAAHLTTAGVSWPVTVGAAIDYLLPETNQAPRDSTWLDLMRRQSTAGLVDAVVARLGSFGPNDNRDYVQRDRFAAAAAAHILETHRPNLLLVHLVETDGAQHESGPDSPAAVAALSRVDGRVSEIVDAARKAGILERTAFVVTGDHGFYRVHSAFQPNDVLREAGLIDVDGEGRIVSWRALAHRAGIRVKDPGDAATARRVDTLFRTLAEGRYHGLLRVVTREEIARLGGDPAAVIMLEPIEGYTLSAGTRGGFLVRSNRGGDHGYLPTEPRMHTGLVVAGAGVRAGVSVPLARQIDIAPTVARLLGFEMRDAEGVAMEGLITGSASQ